MKCTILHEGKGRMRVHVEKVRMTLHRADVLEAYLNHHDAIVHAAVYERTGDVVITYTGKRTAAIAILAAIGSMWPSMTLWSPPPTAAG